MDEEENPTVEEPTLAEKDNEGEPTETEEGADESAETEEAADDDEAPQDVNEEDEEDPAGDDEKKEEESVQVEEADEDAELGIRDEGGEPEPPAKQVSWQDDVVVQVRMFELLKIHNE